MFLVVKSAVEDVEFGTVEAEIIPCGEELIFEPVWAVVGAESFGVSVPEFDCTRWKVFDECSGVVDFVLPAPADFGEEQQSSKGIADFGRGGNT